MILATDIADRVSELRRHLGIDGRTFVAFSGGLDSTVLLHALAARRDLDPLAIYVDHGLADDAAAWRAHVERFAADRGVQLTVLAVSVEAATGDSIEERAREARYRALASALGPGDAVLTAQHAADQAETLLLQLLRGAGVAGLAGMPDYAPLGAGWCLRPMLAIDRPAIEAYARDCRLEWHDDPSNTDTRFSRNYLRLEVLPVLRRRWPALSATLSRAAGLQSEARSLLDQLAAADAHAIAAGGLRVPAGRLAALPPERQRNLLRFLIASRGMRPPPAKRMASILALARGPRSGKVEWGTASIRRYRDTLYILRALPPAPPPGHSWPLRPGEPVRLPDGLGEFLCTEIGGGSMGGAAPNLRVGFRQGGERLVRHDSKGSASLSGWFQAQGIPPWARKRLPLVLHRDRVVAAGTRWTDAQSALAGRYRLRWRDRPTLW